ncbi:MAG: alanine--tRNA ligase [Bryobacteraceae bacterium]|nr:alanine--tRNA ligase [Bryobacteraceae bacterium]
MTGHEIRQTFLDFFAARGHRPVRSSSLVPHEDPTLLFTNAGMNQFKDIFLGQEKRDYSRATTAQKCVRAGGKHNDLENVGYTRRHHTFFEMMGNFSFGDYFKAEAIEFAWDLVTKTFALPKDKLYVTVFREDDEAEELWQKVAGVPKSRIFRLDEKDNFWQMGDTGPCGPCSEIHYDLGLENAAPGHEHEAFPLDGGGRFVEIWNLVFMQYDRSSAGVLTPLPRPSIDTGLGLERVAAILQGKVSNYECDLLEPIRGRAAELFPRGKQVKSATLNICADHARASAFLIHDGVVPANEGRGYVLRKIMRRAMRHARMEGLTDPFLHQLTAFVADFMKPAYPELLESAERVSRMVREEELRYASTFLVAERIFHDEAKAAQGGVIPGPAAFKLYDTYGLALDEQQDMARDLNLTIDTDGFQSAMEDQRTRARASWKGADKAAVNPALQPVKDTHGETKFLAYDHTEATGQVLYASETELVLDQTPFYADSGGQVGDHGLLFDPETGDKVAEVTGTVYGLPKLIVHKVKWLQPLGERKHLLAKIDTERRAATRRNHTSTHLLQAALQNVLGKHIKQAGSVVDPTRLRFDFTHYAGLSPEERASVERIINEHIVQNTEVTTTVMDIDTALKTGAMALFGEKYGDSVRVVDIPGFSRELCGGTHVSRTGDIGVARIVYEGSISAGVRRIEAVTGPEAVIHALEANTAELKAELDKTKEAQKLLERQVAQMKEQLAHAKSGSLEGEAREINGVKVLAARADGLDRAQLRNLVDALRSKWPSAVIVLASADGGQISIVTGVTKDLTSKVHAGKLLGTVAQAVGGKGGGRPDLAEGGGNNVEALAGALEQVYTSVGASL